MLTPYALEHAELLRLLQAGGFATKTELAARLGRDLPNLNKTLKRLEEEGLVAGVALTDAGANAVRMADVVAGGAADAGEMPAGFAQLLWMQIDPDPLNPRKEFDEESIDELADSIARDGLLENLVVRAGVLPEDPFLIRDGQPAAFHRLVAGERRHRAIGRLIETGRWPRDRPLLCRVVDLDDAGHRRVALVENLQRKDLKPLEEARALDELIKVTGVGTADIAAEIGFTQRFVQQRLQLLTLPAIKQVELSEGRLTIEGARKWIAEQPKPLALGSTQALVLLEVAWAISGQHGADRHCKTPIDYHRPTRPPEASPGQPLIHFESDGAGRETARFGNAGWAHLTALAEGHNPLTRDRLEAHVRKARIASLPNSMDGKAKADEIDELFKSKRYMTAWLNPPFEIDPARAAEARRLEAQRRLEEQERQAQRERQEQERRARDERDVKNREREVHMLAAIRLFEAKASDPGRDLAALAGSLMLTLNYDPPFSVAWDGRQVCLRDSKGDDWAGGPQLLEGLRRVMAIAVNNLLGLPLSSGPELPVTPWAIEAREDTLEAAPDRETYVSGIADLLLERDDFNERVEAIDIAAKALDEFLVRHGLTFGDPDEDWELIRDDIYEDAIGSARGDDAPLTAAELRLAGAEA